MNGIITLKNFNYINEIFNNMDYRVSNGSNYKTKNSNDSTDYLIPAEISINQTYNKNYSLKSPFRLPTYLQDDGAITCSDCQTSIYGIGDTVEECKKDFMDSFLYHYNFLKDNKKYLSQIDRDNLVYINKLVIELHSEK